jgi:hypothetical protein
MIWLKSKTLTIIAIGILVVGCGTRDLFVYVKGVAPIDKRCTIEKNSKGSNPQPELISGEFEVIYVMSKSDKTISLLVTCDTTIVLNKSDIPVSGNIDLGKIY